MIEMEEEGCDVKFKSLFEQVQAGNKPIIAVLMMHSSEVYTWLINFATYLAKLLKVKIANFCIGFIENII